MPQGTVLSERRSLSTIAFDCYDPPPKIVTSFRETPFERHKRKARFEAYGNAVVDEDPDANNISVEFNLRFPGQYFDSETALYYNYFRSYDPNAGRYLESDPIGLEGGLNSFSYAGGNPLSYVDVYGLKIHRFPGDIYTDTPATTTAESGCMTPVWSGGYIVGWQPCERDSVCPSGDQSPTSSGSPSRSPNSGPQSPTRAPADSVTRDAVDSQSDSSRQARQQFGTCLANVQQQAVSSIFIAGGSTAVVGIMMNRFGFSRLTTGVSTGIFATGDVALLTAYGIQGTRNCGRKYEESLGL